MMMILHDPHDLGGTVMIILIVIRYWDILWDIMDILRFNVHGGINNDGICMNIIARFDHGGISGPQLRSGRDAIVTWINFWIPEAREKHCLALGNHPQPPHSH